MFQWRRARQIIVGLAAIVASAAVLGSPANDYVLNCMGCHGSTAEGVPGRVPPLAGALPRFMRTAAGRNYVLRVPGAANSTLSDEQLAQVLNWITQNFAGEEHEVPVEPFTAREVSMLRHMPLAAVRASRREVVKDLAKTGSAPAAEY